MVISYYLTMFMTKRYVWALTVVWLAILNMLKQSVWEEYLSTELSEKEICDAMIALSWLMLRVTSFAIDYCNFKRKCIEKAPNDEPKVFTTLQYLAYSFYFPVCLHGPPLIYERYAKMYAKNQLYRVEESLTRFKVLVISLVRVGCVYLLNELCMHLIYANVIIYNPDVSFFPSFLSIFDFDVQVKITNFFSRGIFSIANGTHESLGNIRLRVCDWTVFL